MAHKKGQGTSRNGRDSHSQRLGVKVYGGESIRNGGIIIRQRGRKFVAGPGCDLGKDDTIYAIRDGFVKYESISSHGKRVSVVAERN